MFDSLEKSSDSAGSGNTADPVAPEKVDNPNCGTITKEKLKPRFTKLDKNALYAELKSIQVRVNKKTSD